MPVCVNEARPGGKIRYEWSRRQGRRVLPDRRVSGTGAVQPDRSRGADAPARSVRRTTTSKRRSQPDGTGTLMTMRMTLPDAETRAAMLATGMEHGMEASYVRLEELGSLVART